MFWEAIAFLVAGVVVWAAYEFLPMTVGALALYVKRRLDAGDRHGVARWASRFVNQLVALTHRPCRRCANLNWRAAARCRRCGADIRDAAG
jgi:hypothetical protein